MSRRHMVGRLIKRDGPGCHYCNKILTTSTGTCDHVCPKSMGGPNWIGNYVLACKPCNSLRGTEMNWCDCDFCEPLIANFVYSNKFVDTMFLRMMRFNRPVVRFRTGVWKVYLHTNIHTFKTWEDAIHFALTYGKEPVRGLRKVNR